VLKGLGKLFKNNNASGKSPAQKAVIEYPTDYSLQCTLAIKGLKASKGDYDAIQETGVEELFQNSIQWINDGVEIDLDSLLKLIKAIKRFVPGDSWVEANDFRVHHDVEIENRDFILNPKNSEFLLELVALGEDGHHFACKLLIVFKDDLSLKFIADLIEVLTHSPEVVQCEHWQLTPVLGSPFIELIRTQRLSTAQLNCIYNFVTSRKNYELRILISTLELYLSNNPQTSPTLVEKFTKNQDLVWAWVSVKNPKEHLEVWRGEAFIEVNVGEYAQRALHSRAK
jgi:hypothetical protein